MSIICNKCGIQTRDSAKFCHGCGTPISTAALPATMPIGVPSGDIPPKPAVPLTPEPSTNFSKATEAMGQPQTSYIPQAPPSNYQPAITKPKRSGNGVKIFLGILVFLGVIMVVSIIGGLFIANKAIEKVKNLPPGTEFPIKIGDNVKLNVGNPELTEEALGVPPYPDAKLTSPFNFSAEVDSGERGALVTLETKDEYDKVVEWYLEKMGNDARRTRHEDNDKKVTKYELKDDRGYRSVEITGYYRNRKNTEIVIFSALESALDAAQDAAQPSAEAPAPAKAGKQKVVVPVPPAPPAPASDQNLGETIKEINKQVEDATLDQATKQAEDQVEKSPIPAKIKRQIREQIRDARRQERQNAVPNQD